MRVVSVSLNHDPTKSIKDYIGNYPLYIQWQDGYKMIFALTDDDYASRFEGEVSKVNLDTHWDFNRGYTVI